MRVTRPKRKQTLAVPRRAGPDRGIPMGSSENGPAAERTADDWDRVAELQCLARDLGIDAAILAAFVARRRPDEISVGLGIDLTYVYQCRQAFLTGDYPPALLAVRMRIVRDLHGDAAQILLDENRRLRRQLAALGCEGIDR